ncbi:MAG: hypothetical protein HOV81_01560 [Kofleriaceae bacterium]|nr:hypothetical protein [Kofleriaceae bacterium]
MKRLLLLGLLLSACKINDATFTPLGGGGDDAGPGDGRRDDTGPPLDGPSTQSLRRGYYLDAQVGFYILDKAADGSLSMTAGFSGGGGSVLVANGNHVYVGGIVSGSGGVRDATIQGSTVTMSNERPLTGCQEVRHMVLHPSGSPLLVTCANASAFLISIGTNGGLGNATPVFPNAINELTPAWSKDGQCLFLTDNGAPAAQSVQAYRFDGAGLSFTLTNRISGPHAKDIEVHPTDNYVYMTSLLDLQAYSFNATCALAPVGGVQTSGLQNANGLAINPAGTRLFQLGERIVPYSIEADGRAFQIPGVTGPQATHLDGVFDPTMPNVMYTLAALPPRIYQARIDAAGNVTVGPSFSAGGQSPTDFVLVP